MEHNRDIEYGHKSKYPPEHLISDVQEFFKGSSILKHMTARGVAQDAQDLMRGLIR